MIWIFFGICSINSGILFLLFRNIFKILYYYYSFEYLFLALLFHLNNFFFYLMLMKIDSFHNYYCYCLWYNLKLKLLKVFYDMNKVFALKIQFHFCNGYLFDSLISIPWLILILIYAHFRIILNFEFHMILILFYFIVN